MEVIPLTLAISLLLSLTFIFLFVHEFTRPRRAGADRDSLLPLEDDLPRGAVALAASPARQTADSEHGHDHEHAHEHNHVDGDEVCASKRKDGKCCASCLRRQARAAGKTVSAAQS